MPLKDWKRTKTSEDLYYWYNKKNGEGIIINKKGKYYYFGFEPTYIANSYEKRIGKTKSQALKYARDYMRKH
jgi:hypothetical protein